MQLASEEANALMLEPIPIFGRSVSAEALLVPGLNTAVKERLADAALKAAKSKVASCPNVCIGRYLNSLLPAITRFRASQIRSCMV